ncbi:MAG: SDR family NAD(P)-dependent oxidoreductase [Geminicoccaceae bacterium]|nr:SDR family NAD(P)-dependent oxidoreductase [Geminicoccaceae bacterium]MCX7628792.1 SDR family NAD(P)-dependent oxidoreductase [Geminicoccaceae bacterium]MDW8123397.1 SDR family NAD(P)-dependent oxidoreductase [Geminicoccaceae bacterium]
MAVLVTGAAGFIGMHVARALLERGEEVLGLDNLNPYYDPALKRARLAELERYPAFRFARLDLAEEEQVVAFAREHALRIRAVVHMAAQAGVRYSLERPMDYVRSNLVGHMVVLETCRHHLPRLEHLVYASSSSVYGANEKIPFSVEDPVDRPVSLYAATKRADEILSQVYAHLYGIPQTGLRFFTVYGPWGRPDMAYYAFTDAITAGRPITLYNEGRMRRDFTWIEDVVDGVLRALDRPPSPAPGRPPHRLYNLGNHEPVELLRFVAVLEQAIGKKADLRFAPMQPGDVVETYADIEATSRDLGWRPRTSIEEGLPRFVAWHRGYHATRGIP